MDLSRVEIDGKSGKVIFHGTCLEMHEVCQAWCCRNPWCVEITEQEFASGRYLAQAICISSGKECHDLSKACRHRRYQLSKNPDKSCVHLADNHCGIYSVRPQVCRDFQCQGGWQLRTASLPSTGSDLEKTAVTLTRESFLERIRGEAVFILHPLIKLHTLFYIKAKGELIFVKEMVGSCGKFNTREVFAYPQLDDKQILLMIDLFGRKESLLQIYTCYCASYPGRLTLQDFYNVVWVLNKHNIVLDSRNFTGMLAGMGGID